METMTTAEQPLTTSDLCTAHWAPRAKLREFGYGDYRGDMMTSQGYGDPGRVVGPVRIRPCDGKILVLAPGWEWSTPVEVANTLLDVGVPRNEAVNVYACLDRLVSDCLDAAERSSDVIAAVRSTTRGTTHYAWAYYAATGRMVRRLADEAGEHRGPSSCAFAAAEAEQWARRSGRRVIVQNEVS